MKKKTLRFPPGFLWGSAISAHQTEGNNRNSDWWGWEYSRKREAELKQKGENQKDYQSGQACDFYHRYEADLDVAQKLNHNAFRLSVEWARIQPEPGRFLEAELRHYRQVLQTVRKRGMKSFVALHHFTNPLWFAQRGGFEEEGNIEHFATFAEKTAARIGDVVDFWLTINEPEVYASHAYLYGRYPPHKKNMILALRVVKNLITAHNLAAPLLRRISGKPVSMAYHLIDFVPASIFSRLSRNAVHYLMNEYILSHTVQNCDFIGVNYYGHSHVNVLGRRLKSRSRHAVSDLGWGIHPEGLERVLLSVKKYDKPIYVTENGVADAADVKREKFIKDHLFYLHRAIQQGADVRGYFYWSLLDNFEWHHGFKPRFGLVEVDYKTQRRTVRQSALAYAKICKSNRLEYQIPNF